MNNENFLIFNGIKYKLVEVEENEEPKAKGFNFSKSSLEKLSKVHPRLVKVLQEAIKTSPFDFKIIWGARTTKEQQQLFSKGRTTKGNIVTNCDGVIKKSNHQTKTDGFGYAIDFAIYDPTKPGNVDWQSIDKYIAVANHILNVGKEEDLVLISGKDFKNFKDYGHIELKGVIKNEK